MKDAARRSFDTARGARRLRMTKSGGRVENIDGRITLQRGRVSEVICTHHISVMSLKCARRYGDSAESQPLPHSKELYFCHPEPASTASRVEGPARSDVCLQAGLGSDHLGLNDSIRPIDFTNRPRCGAIPAPIPSPQPLPFVILRVCEFLETRGCHPERSEQRERSERISDSSASAGAATRAGAYGAGTGFFVRAALRLYLQCPTSKKSQPLSQRGDELATSPEDRGTKELASRVDTSGARSPRGASRRAPVERSGTSK